MSANGAFVLSVLPQKPFTLHIKPDHYLAANVSIDMTNGTALGVTAILLTGDANNDNSIDATDFGIFVSAYNSSAAVPGPGYDSAADFNSDGNVDAADFGLLVGNYNKMGAN